MIKIRAWDWEEVLDTEDIAALVEPFGLFAYELPSCEGSDSYGVVISDKKLTSEQLDEIDEKWLDGTP